jgi:FtsH-binding integral membrane protein
VRRVQDVRRAAFYLVTTVAAGDTFHLLAHSLQLQVSHHAFHLLFSVGAVAIFAAYVAVDVRRRGWPGISWRL